MRCRLRAVAFATSLIATAALVTAPPAAVAAPGTFTAITTPSDGVIQALAADGTDSFAVAGTTSGDVSAVDLVCLNSTNGAPTPFYFAHNVSVNGGQFHTVVGGQSINTCRLRALPAGTPVTDYLAAYTGPVLRANAFLNAPSARSFSAMAEQGDGEVNLGDTGLCGVFLLLTVQSPAMAVGPRTAGCILSLPLDPVNATRSAVLVDGHGTYLPDQVHNIMNTQIAGGGLGLSLAEAPLDVTFARTPAGEITVTESGSLRRCHDANGVNDTFPPTPASCTTLVDSGVSFRRTAHFLRGHQIQVRDSFASLDGQAHTVDLAYHNGVRVPVAGEVGYLFPTHGAAFQPGTAGTPISGFGAGAATMYVRSDLHAAVDDAAADTLGLTWSRPPTAVTVLPTNADFALRYVLPVPAAGAASLGLAATESLSTSAVQALAGAAQADVMNAPSITTPTNGALIGIQSTTVRGEVTAGANGLPTAVSVNGHPATLTPIDATRAAYSVQFAQSWGSHAVTVTAADVAGNTASASVTVTNTPALAAGSRARLSRSTLRVPVTCRNFAAGTCTGQVVVKTTRGAVIGRSRAVGVARGRTAAVGVRIRPGVHVVRVYLYQREPTGAYVLVATKTYRV